MYYITQAPSGTQQILARSDCKALGRHSSNVKPKGRRPEGFTVTMCQYLLRVAQRRVCVITVA